MTNILVVDNDASARHMLTDYLCENAFEVEAMESLSSLQGSPEAKNIDLIIANMGEERALEASLVQDLCASSTVPVIVTSADRIDETDKVAALEGGAADYIVKPFGLRELLARVRVALRSAKPDRGPKHVVYTFDNWRLNTRHRKLRDAQGIDIKLTAAELNLLIAFLQSPRQILSREQLLMATRVHDQEIFDRSIDVLILRLRRKLEENPSSPRYIKTERRAGYNFDVDVHAAPLRTRAG